MRIRRRKRLQKRKKIDWMIFFLKIALAISLAWLAVTWIDLRMRPVISEVASNYAKLQAQQMMNQAVAAELGRSEDPYVNLTEIIKDTSGRITAVETNTVHINRLKTNITSAVAERFLNLQEQEIEIPLGNFLDVQFFAGRGPKLGFRMTPSGFLETEFFSQFESAGINQTCHQIMMRVTLHMSVIFPGYRIPISVSGDYCVSETIIVGVTPDFFVGSQS